MPIKDPVRRRLHHNWYMREVWYPANKKRHIQLNKVSLKRRTQKRLAMLKANAACSRCGESHPATLDFHHRDPSTKEFRISTALRDCSMRRLLAEVAKCDVLCSNCHRKHHSTRYSFYPSA